VTGSFYTSLALNVLVFGLLAMSLDFLAGYAGLISFGHAAYLGIGAYGVGYAQKNMHGAWWSVGYAVLCVLVAALVFGLIAVRVTGISFGIVTMALGGIVWGLAFRWVSVSGGDNGLPIMFRPEIAGIDLMNSDNYYYVVLVVFVVSAAILALIVRSPFGLSLRGIKDNEKRMRTLGYGVGLHKYIAYVISAFFAGIAGILYAFYNLYIGPTALDIGHNFIAVMMVVVGGLGTLWGGLVGSLVIVLLQQWASLYVERWAMLMGGIFVLTVLFARAGLFGSLLLGFRWLERRAGVSRDPGE
jgi:branched-chain amino acid transport system permease protein